MALSSYGSGSLTSLMKAWRLYVVGTREGDRIRVNFSNVSLRLSQITTIMGISSNFHFSLFHASYSVIGNTTTTGRWSIVVHHRRLFYYIIASHFFIFSSSFFLSSSPLLLLFIILFSSFSSLVNVRRGKRTYAYQMLVNHNRPQLKQAYLKGKS